MNNCKQFWYVFLVCILLLNGLNAQTISINSGWKFHKGDLEDISNTQTENWELVNLPHSWNSEDAFDDEDGFYRGTGWYQKSIFIKETSKNQRLFISFEGANQVTGVFVNGIAVGEHKGGYTGFRFDVTDAVEFGKENVFKVKVDNSLNENIPPLSADFTFYGGIYRDVYLSHKNPIHFSTYQGAEHVFVNQELSNGKAVLSIDAGVSNLSNASERIVVETTVFNTNWEEIVSASEKIKVGKSATKDLEQKLVLKNPKLWTPDRPYLYNLDTEIKSANGEVLDSYRTTIGVRSIALDDNGIFLLNGKPLKLVGTNRHQDFEGLGNALPNQYHENDIKPVKEMGANFMRMAHYPHDPRVLEMCDKYGILVWQEIPIVNRITETDAFTKNSETMLKEMIAQYRNHPSIVMWGFMNEVILRPLDDVKGDTVRRNEYWGNISKLTKHLNSVVKKEDPARLTVIANHDRYDAYERMGLNSITDVIGYNIYYGWYGARFEDLDDFTDKIKRDHPEKGYIIAEYGAGADPRIHSYVPERFDFSIEWQQQYHAYYLNHILESDKVTGATIWNLADFGSEERVDAVPNINSKGVLNFDRTPKDVFYLYKAALNEEPLVKIASSDWNYRAGEGIASSTQEITVYSNANEVALFHNGNKTATKPTEFYTATFDVPFVNGKNVLKAVATINGKTTEDILSIDFNLIPENLKTADLPNDFQLKVNVGSPFYFVDPAAKEIWLPEKAYTKNSHGYLGGTKYQRQSWNSKKLGSDQSIALTNLDPLYQTMRDSIEGYKFDVPKGRYEITLHFAELYSKKPSKELVYNLGDDAASAVAKEDRTFNVLVNNKEYLHHFSPIKNHGEFTPIVEKMEVFVGDDEGISIDFQSKKIGAILNAIELRKIN
ncbi:glycoside hydrolase family 2 TIM barrel-domain containing protein [Galbibacter mesophilus]|uniref:glycoside hydrolase family 2 TIM barrel-domain containing protein n=1 Tax=Galbibacter mesophilus TaxID=379069 RepID=UPI00191CF218|nr:glycoside hydrolase family 2 TIM barrel-domain containing protein [Galbibacter mesophilus]MCM5662735.1 malectin domain-containing carbohydrate-binding protein [Galbibacter mesophilus]